MSLKKARLAGATGVRIGTVAAAAFVMQSCSGLQSPLNPGGDLAERIDRLFWIFFAITAVVWLLVIIAMFSGLRRKPPRPDPLAVQPDVERRMGVTVASAAGTTAAILIALTLYSFFATRGFGVIPGDALRISVIGNQWWWEVQYQGANPAGQFTTANEIHVPIGRPVSLTLNSRDVIHSFWVPNLAGKMDLIPGRTNILNFTPTRAGIYRGQCAEYCGLQHAHMALLVVVEQPDEFDAWRSNELADAPTPSDPEATRGMAVFTADGCAGCHTVRGTGAGGMLGPDLTHVGRRRTVAAGTLPNSRGNLQAWIADPQGIKPGAKMPRLDLSGPDLQAVATYIAGLK
jgi:cytochrome c oxidase subunit 2